MKLLIDKIFEIAYTIVVLILLFELCMITFIAVCLNLYRIALWGIRNTYAVLWWSHHRGFVSDRDFEELRKQYDEAAEKIKGKI